MDKNVLNTDLTGKVAVITGAGGVLCSAFAKVLARAGAKVALLDLNEEAARQFAGEITAEGGTAKAYRCDVLDKEACYAVADAVEAELGKCDILINGAGGNNPRATTDKEYYEDGDIDAGVKSFFDLDKSGVEFVFQPELHRDADSDAGVRPPDGGARGLQHSQHLLDERLHPADENSRLLRREGRRQQLHAVARRPLLEGGHPRERHRARLLLDEAKPASSLP